MPKLSIIILITFIPLIGSAQVEKKKTRVDPNIRPESEVVLKFEHKIKIPETKRFNDKGVLLLFAGDTVHLEFQEVKGKLVRPKVVDKVKYPKRSITFEMTQDASITKLFRETQIQKTVAVDCEHQSLRSEDFSPTNLFPTEKGLVIGDSWSNAVWAIRISNIEVTSKSAEKVYEERISKNNKKANKAK